MKREELEEIVRTAVAKALREEILRLETWPRWLTLAEACRYARLSRNTLKKLIYEGYISGRRVERGKWIVDRLSIDAYYQGEDLLVAQRVKEML